ncbi:ABC transporter ATP-binding protein [Candidatus Mycoplasma haematohominis]|uniref:Cobalt import ATP-binding protein CbiO n=1 Tax=Candidatus Mycoplasma haematohominis TaxID=1494318 RepID=A0A478FPD9_9MOLU|nr:ABC transporter ATP-binding protein [Candidatus Mycoplasma haemohominis]GCE63203.1 cobalt import ATP-binding protein CbiO [Candidatus Mycoplasma haemohominis]
MGSFLDNKDVDANKGKADERDIVAEYDKLKREFRNLEREEKQLKDYLNVNVFDYAQNTQQIEDIFSIHNPSMAFLDYDPEKHKINPNIPVIDVNNLTKFYASRKVPSLLNVSLKIYLGDIHVIVGPNGSGKTTLFNCLKGIEDYEGEILVDGKELQQHPDFVSDEIVSFVSHEFGWDLYSTVEDVIAERFQELNRTEIEMQNYIRSSLEQLNISYLRNLHIIDLSLLEKRKVQIVIALISDPHVILFDEIFLGLQQHEYFELLVIFNKLKAEDRALVIFSHSFDESAKFANTITVLVEGGVYFTGAVSNFLYTKLLNYSVSTSDNKKALDILSKLEGCSFSYKDVVDTIWVKFDGTLNLLKFQQECVAQQLIIQELSLLETKLEDLYDVLRNVGNKEAIKTINTLSFFTPE